VLWPGSTPVFHVIPGRLPLRATTNSTPTCTTTADGRCFSSPNFPSNYGGGSSSESCTIMVGADVRLVVQTFDTRWYYDVLTVNGDQYTGSGAGLNGRMVRAGDPISWSSGTQGVGFSICSDFGTCSYVEACVRSFSDSFGAASRSWLIPVQICVCVS